jgi:hypothetical protein
MEVFSDVIDRSLPEQASTVVAFFPAIPIAITSANILGVVSHSIFYWALGSLIVSTIFAFFSYYVPRPIRLRTTILSFLMWFVLFMGFAEAGIGFRDKVGYVLGVLLAIGMLLCLVVYYLFKSIFDDISTSDSSEQSYIIKELFIKILLYLTVVLCLVSLLAIPMTMFFANPTTEKVLIVTSSLHVGIFGFWLITAGLVAIYQK